MERRTFIKRGMLAVSLTGVGGELFSFVPDDFWDGNHTYKNRIPFRKIARKINEVVPGFLWADAADFGSYGGWALDTQHVGFMGSSYLIAHGTSQTVKNAWLKIKDVKPGKYRLWVRSRNWIPEHSPGKFGVLVNGTDSGKVYGSQSEKGWTWQDGGIHELSGKTRLELNDLTGFYGRCSSILLTRELDYQPPADVEAFNTERARLSGVSDAIKPTKDFDVVVIGAGASGCCAALAAARQGMAVALVSDRPVLGGNASVEIGVPVQGAANHQKMGRETGIIEEAGRIGGAKGYGRVMSRPFAELVSDERNLTLIENAWLESVQMSGKEIRKAILRDTLTGERKMVSGQIFIDCSGDSWLGYHAGADFRLGREGRDEHNEMHAPEKGDSITMSGCLRGPEETFKECLFYRTVEEATPHTFTSPPWIYDLPDGWFNERGPESYHLGEAKNGTWWYEHPGDVDDLWDPEFARDQLLRVNFTMWDFWKNTWENKSALENYRLDYIPFMNGKRETRRLMGDYILDENDCVVGRSFPDAIGHYGWTLDLHAPAGILDTTGRYFMDTPVPMGHIPYRCLYSRNVNNLLMAGRNVSVTHVALGTVRVIGQCSLMGQAAGTAAALAVRHATTPRGIYQKHMHELQQTLLKNDQTIPAVLNVDPDDFARSATVTCSSHRKEITRDDLQIPRIGSRRFPMDVPRGELFENKQGKPIKSVWLYLHSGSEREVTLHLREATSMTDTSASQDFKQVTRMITTGGPQWFEFKLDADLTTPYGWVYLDSAPDLFWVSDDAHMLKRRRLFADGGSHWNAVDLDHMSLIVDTGDLFVGQNIVNGFAYRTKEFPNLWESSPEEPLPQSIELKFPRPLTVSSIQCVFDTDLAMSLASQREGIPSVCVRDYTLEAMVDGNWRRLTRIRDNFQRFRRHQFVRFSTDRIRLVVEATNGHHSARLFEMRVY